jgi:hypothetical protein
MNISINRQHNSIFLIEKIWIDSLENNPNRAVGYSIIGYVENEDIAKDICSKSKIYTQKDCWAILEEMPEYRYKKILNVT